MAVIVMLLASTAIIAHLVWSDSVRGGMYQKWSYGKGGDAAYSTGSYDILHLNNGTLVGTGYEQSWFDGRHSRHIFGMDTNGTLLWTYPTNAQPSPSQGADGSYYIVDWLDGATGQSNDPKTQWRNITALNADGSFRWNYIAWNGSVALYTTYPDGTAIVAHMDGPYNWLYEPNEIMAISKGGEVIWNATFPLPGRSVTQPHILGNGTFAVIAYNATESFEVGFNREDGSSYIERINYTHVRRENPLSMRGNIQFELRKIVIDETTTEAGAYAINLTDGSVVWNTTLYQADNPEHNPPGGYQLRSPLVGSTGVILCADFEGKNTYALDLNGSLLWTSNVWYGGVDTYPDGGFLVMTEHYLKKIGPDGALIWQYDATTFSGGWSYVILGPDETIYYSTGTSVVAVGHSDAMSGNVLIIAIIGLFNAAVLATLWLTRKKV